MSEPKADGGQKLQEQFRRDLQYLRTGNADERFYAQEHVGGEASRDQDPFGVETKLQRLEDRLLKDGSGDGPKPRLVLLVAQAGDGKTHFFRQLAESVENQRQEPVRFFWKDTVDESEQTQLDGGRVVRGLDLEEAVQQQPESLFERDENAWWFVNDPSQSGPERAEDFLAHAWRDLREGGTSRHYIFGINRGKLREFLVQDDWLGGNDQPDGLREWLNRAAELDSSVHRIQSFEEGSSGNLGRVVVPLDHRVLVPAPGSETSGAEASIAYKAARRISEYFHDRYGEDRYLTEVEGDDGETVEIADAAACILGLVEAIGFHVTFRQIQNYCAFVVDAMREAEEQSRRQTALQALFFEDYESGAAEQMADIVRRLDPARIAHPELDCKYKSSSERDYQVRLRALNQLTDLFERSTETGSRELRLPYPVAHDYLTICRRLADCHDQHLETRRQLRGLELPEIETERVSTDDVERLQETLERAELPLYKNQTEAGEEGNGWLVPSAETFFRGLSRLAWGSAASNAEGRTDADTTEVLPLAAPIHPGDTVGTGRWRALRAAVGRERLVVRTRVADTGEFIEDELQRPELVVRGSESGPDDSPGLPLTLELYEAVCRYGREQNITQGQLGPMAERVYDWLDAVVAEWHETLLEDRNDFVVYQTLIGPDSKPRHIPLRRSEPGTNVERRQATGDHDQDDVVDVLRDLWPESGSGGGGENTFAVTPAACASALLQWAGCRPAESRNREEGAADPVMRELLGARARESLRGRYTYHSPAFPWSVDMLTTTYRLGHGPQLSSEDDRWTKLGPRLGAKCAEALGLQEEEEEWRGALRSAWSADEDAFDTHPAARLAHQLLDLGVGGRQLDDFEGTRVKPDHDCGDLRIRVMRRLLSGSVPVPAAERWWLIGTWAAWWTFLGAISEEESGRSVSLDGYPPVWIPRTSDVDPQYSEACKKIWLFETDGDAENAREAIAAVGQVCGFLQGPNRRTNFEFRLDGAVLTLIRLLAHDYVQQKQVGGEVADFSGFRDHLRQGGIFSGTTDLDIDLKAGGPLKRWENQDDLLLDPVEELVKRKLDHLSLLNRQEAADGITSVRDPWPGE